MLNGKLEQPLVRIEPSGVSRVAAADIVRSKVGQVEIGKAAAVAVALKLRKPQASSPSKS
jgi:hypothetical protein